MQVKCRAIYLILITLILLLLEELLEGAIQRWEKQTDEEVGTHIDERLRCLKEVLPTLRLAPLRMPVHDRLIRNTVFVV
jgi:membrane glycosyltransferase